MKDLYLNIKLEGGKEVIAAINNLRSSLVNLKVVIGDDRE